MSTDERSNALTEDCKAINKLIDDVALTMQRSTSFLRTLGEMTMPIQQFQGDEVSTEQFGMDMTDWDVSATNAHGASHPQSKLKVAKKTGVDDSEHFRVVIYVPEFSPDQAHVSIVDDYVVINCKHPERSDKAGLVSRQFTRRYVLPKGIENTDVTSYINEGAALTVEAKKRTTGVSTKDGFHVVPITYKPQSASTEVQKDAESSSEGMQTDTPSVESVLTPDTPSTE